MSDNNFGIGASLLGDLCQCQSYPSLAPQTLNQLMYALEIVDHLPPAILQPILQNLVSFLQMDISTASTIRCL